MNLEVDYNKSIKKTKSLRLRNYSLRPKNITLSLLALLSIVNIFIYIVPALFFVFVIFAIQIISLNKYESAFLFALFASTFGSYFSVVQNVKGVGSILLLISIVIYVIDYKYLFIKYFNNIKPLLIILFALSLSVLFSKGGNFANQKLILTITTGLVTAFVFAHYLYYPQKYRSQFLSLMIVVYGLFIIRYAMNFYGYSSFKGIFFIGMLRTIIGDVNIEDLALKLDYQEIGFMGVFAISLLFFSNKDKINHILYYLIYTLSALVVLFSGSRQALLTLIILIGFDILRSNGSKNGIKNVVLFIGFIVVVFFILENLKVDFIQTIVKSNNVIEASGRSPLIDVGIQQYLKSPFWGVGYGRYVNPDGVYGGYPHNMFIELLCETGISGLLLVILVLVGFFKTNYAVFKTNKRYLFGGFCLLITFFVRAMVSEGFSSNIELFAVLFMLPLYRYNNKIIKARK